MAQQAVNVNPLVRVVSPEQLQKAERAAAESTASSANETQMSELAAHVRQRLMDMRNYRDQMGITLQLLKSMRAYRGQYEPDKLADVKQFNGSEVYARITATKCRAATALLRDIYLGSDRPWEIDPTPVPVLPDSIKDSITSLVATEASTMTQAGAPPDEGTIRDRVTQLYTAAKAAARAKAQDDSEQSERKIEDVLQEGGFYEAYSQFLADLPIFPYAIIKGPVVEKRPVIQWVNGKATRKADDKPYWKRVSPFDLFWTGGAATISQAEFCEHQVITRGELAAMRTSPGYNTDAIDEILSEYNHKGGNYRWWNSEEFTRAVLEKRDSTLSDLNDGLIDVVEFHGRVSGRLLDTWEIGIKEKNLNDEYYVALWMVDRFVIKVQISPFSFQPCPYYIGRYNQVPGSLIGEGLPEVLSDIQDVCNATLRALVNNLSIASGPQVAINDGAGFAASTDDTMFPWKRWHFNVDPALQSSGQKAIEFFQPTSNSGELLQVFAQFAVLADEVSALPRYMTGSSSVGGAGRTASGLAMLISNASKTLQNVAAGLDRDVMSPLLHNLYDYMMILDPSNFRGDETVVVKGVTFAVKREQDRMRQLEFLQMTANPIDAQLLGADGRLKLLGSIAKTLGLEGVVPDKPPQPPQPQPGAPGVPGAPGAPPQPGQAPGIASPPGVGAARQGPEAVRQQVEGTANAFTPQPQ